MSRETTTKHWARRPRRGFNIIELMIVVVILGILAAIAFPSYNAYVVRSHRRAAQAQMTEIANRQQQYFMATRSYAAHADAGDPSIDELSYSLPADVDEYYGVTVTVQAAPPGFQIRFIGEGNQAADGWLQLDASGSKTSEYPKKW